MSNIRLHNTLTKQKEVFTPSRKGVLGFLGIPNKTVTMYNCGPTVYQSPHIGNFRPYIFADTLKRVLEFNSYSVKQVINITDVGALVGDGDEGEDRMQLSVQKQQRSSKEISEEYTEEFFDGLRKLHINIADTKFPRATQYIPEQIALITILEKKGCTYRTSDGIYFDTSKFSRYGELGDIDLLGLDEGHRVAMIKEKRNSTDFALWKFSSTKRDQDWPSPWGVGFPGWHIECSAMAMKLLGKTIDIHTGGVDHIPTHHNNEIAQSESASGERFVRFWLHNAHILTDGQKISKSLGNTIYLKDLAAHGVTPLGLRYWYLTASYRTQMNFTWEAVKGAQTAYERLLQQVRGLLKTHDWDKTSGKVSVIYKKAFLEGINDDLNTPKAIATMRDMLRDASVSGEEKLNTLKEFDTALGLELLAASVVQPHIFPDEIIDLKNQRDVAREQKDFKKSDELRLALSSKGYDILDTNTGSKLMKK